MLSETSGLRSVSSRNAEQQFYMINRDAATKLLSRSRFFRAVDEDLSWPWELGLSVWSVSPNPVAEVSHTLGRSLLEADRKAGKRKKNIARSLWGNVIQATLCPKCDRLCRESVLDRRLNF